MKPLKGLSLAAHRVTNEVIVLLSDEAPEGALAYSTAADSVVER